MPLVLRAAPNCPLNITSQSSTSTPSLVRKIFWKVLLDTPAAFTISATVVSLYPLSRNSRTHAARILFFASALSYLRAMTIDPFYGMIGLCANYRTILLSIQVQNLFMELRCYKDSKISSLTSNQSPHFFTFVASNR